MKILKKVSQMLILLKKIILSKKDENYQYRIISFSKETYIIAFQCNQTRAIFFRHIISVIFDPDFVADIEPDQACYLGLMLGQGLRKGNLSIKGNNIRTLGLLSNIGKSKQFNLIFDRYDNIIFYDPIKKIKCVVQSIKVVSSYRLINLFPPTIACAIGIHVGYKKVISASLRKSVVKLRVVK